jgi:hypothetical protein
MAQYLMFEDPNKSPVQCLAESSSMMKGRKWNLFILDLSFIFWYLLSLVTGGLAGLFAGPYHALARAGFYRESRNQMIAAVVPEAPIGSIDAGFEHNAGVTVSVEEVAVFSAEEATIDSDVPLDETHGLA